jgi:hypothetical protein
MHPSVLAPLVLVAACGRIGFDPTGPAGDSSASDAPLGDGAAGDGTADSATDAPVDTMVASCADMDLGSALGPSVASGNTGSTGDDYNACAGGGSPDLSFRWVAPATATFRIDLCGSNIVWDSALTVRSASCTGAQLACDDDSCMTSLHARINLSATAGSTYIIIVDGSGGGESGTYQLAIAQL